MQQFVGQPASQLGHDVERVAAVAQQALGLLQLFVAQALGLLAIGAQHVYRGQLAQALHEVVDAADHQLFGRLGCTLAAFQVLRDHFVEIVDAI
ncbi:hypothetical protein D3C81_1630240 [compost metagenome]